MNFRDLTYVITVAQQASFSKAAKLCHVSQPSLSAQIKKLEDQLQGKLFIRDKRNVHVTEMGKAFIAKAERILSLQEEILALNSMCSQDLSGPVRLGAILTVAPYLFPSIIKTTKAHAPNLHLTLQEGTTESLVAKLLDGSLDAALLSLPTDRNLFTQRPLVTEPFYLATAQDHPLASKDIVTHDDLSGQALLLLDEGHCFRDQALDICQRYTLRENKTFQATSLETIRHFVSIDDGITLMPAMARRNGDGIAYTPLRDNAERTIGLVWRKQSNLAHKLERLSALLAEDL